jgi:hypothetical protein
MSKILLALEILRKAKTEINDLFNDPQHNQSLLEINANLKKVETRLEYMSAVLAPAQKGTTSKKPFPPLKSFMGQKLTANQPLKTEDLTPSESRKKAFLAKAHKLYDEIGNYPPASILTNYRIKEDIILIRWVAKQAGVKDFETRELTTDFIEEIQMAVQLKNEEEETQAAVDFSINGTPDPEIITLQDGEEDMEPGIEQQDQKLTKKTNKKKLPPAE